ncbi:MAG TPA: hypothetical protein PKX78_02080 [Candidatus Woesebacteria bacterium]|nr:hypothetical protein [Candidatus Woesebacteria bacterium]
MERQTDPFVVAPGYRPDIQNSPTDGNIPLWWIEELMEQRRQLETQMKENSKPWIMWTQGEQEAYWALRKAIDDQVESLVEQITGGQQNLEMAPQYAALVEQLARGPVRLDIKLPENAERRYGTQTGFYFIGRDLTQLPEALERGGKDQGIDLTTKPIDAFTYLLNEEWMTLETALAAAKCLGMGGFVLTSPSIRRWQNWLSTPNTDKGGH